MNAQQELLIKNKLKIPPWQRFILLFISGYETLGCLAGGSFLIASPEGKFMDMPVELM